MWLSSWESKNEFCILLSLQRSGALPLLSQLLLPHSHCLPFLPLFTLLHAVDRTPFDIARCAHANQCWPNWNHVHMQCEAVLSLLTYTEVFSFGLYLEQLVQVWLRSNGEYIYRYQLYNNSTQLSLSNQLSGLKGVVRQVIKKLASWHHTYLTLQHAHERMQSASEQNS